MSKVINLSISTLQRARKELIDNNYIKYRKGKNQNDASTYSIIKLYQEEQTHEQADEQASEQAHEQAHEQADEHIIIKLNNLFNYINEEDATSFEDMTYEDKQHIVEILKRLDLYANSKEFIEYLKDTKQLQKYQVFYYAIKEIHLSEHSSILNEITRKKLVRIYKSTERYIYAKENYTMLDFLNYFIKCIKNEAEEVFKYAM